MSPFSIAISPLPRSEETGRADRSGSSRDLLAGRFFAHVCLLLTVREGAKDTETKALLIKIGLIFPMDPTQETLEF
jgi:hypothetical protein